MRHLPMQYSERVPPQAYPDLDYVVLPETQSVPERNVLDYLSILRIRKWTLLAPTLLLFPILVLYIISKSPLYEAKASVLIEKINPNVIQIDEHRSNNISPDFQRTQQEIIKSKIISEKVVENLQLYNIFPEDNSYIEQKFIDFKSIIKNIIGLPINYIEGKETRKNDIHYEIDEEKIIKEAAIIKLQESLSIEPRVHTQIVDIVITNKNPIEAAQQVNMVAQTFLRHNLENKIDESRKAISWLRKRSRELYIKINNAENNIQKFKEAKQLAAIGKFNETHNMNMEQLNSLQESYIKINSERSEINIKIAEIERISKKDLNEIIGSSSELFDSKSISSLRAEYVSLKNEYNNLSKKFRSKHPKLVRIKEKLELILESTYTEIRNLISSMKKQHDLLLAQERDIENKLSQKRTNFIKSSGDVLAYAKLNEGLDIDRQLYLTVSKRLAETTLTEALETNNIKMLELAGIPGQPVSRSKLQSLLLSLFSLLGLGAGLAIFLDSLDKRFRTIDEVEQCLGMNFLGLVPTYKTSNHKLITLSDPAASAAEAFRSLRTWMPVTSTDDTKALLITSSLPGEGKSTTSANLAISFAQLGHLVVLVDTDLRRPNVHHVFDKPQNSGLVDILDRGAEWQSVLQDSDLENLKLIFTGGRPHNPAELLSTKRMHNLMASLKESFDIIIIDAPVTLTIPDVPILVPNTDGILLIHDPSKGDKTITLETKRILDRAGAHILGVVFNNVSPKRQREYYGSRTYYSYTYGQQPTRPRKAGSPLVDMRPTDNRQKWLSVPSAQHASNDNEI